MVDKLPGRSEVMRTSDADIPDVHKNGRTCQRMPTQPDKWPSRDASNGCQQVLGIQGCQQGTINRYHQRMPPLLEIMGFKRLIGSYADKLPGHSLFTYEILEIENLHE